MSKNILNSLRCIYRNLKVNVGLVSKTNISYDNADKRIREIWDKECPVFCQYNKINPLYDLMIIISVYNTGEYLEECIRSFVGQKTRYSFGVVIVNDGSTDNSAVILQKYENVENIKIIHQENRGFSGARNQALKEILGKYVMFLDSDDTLPMNAIEILMDTAMENNADIVAGGYNVFSESGVLSNHVLGTTIQKVFPRDMPGFTCMKVIRAELLKNFCFPENYLFEDTVLSKLVYPICKCAYTVPDIVYNYRSHTGSISQSFDKHRACIDTYWITKYCLEESKMRDYSFDAYAYEEYLKQCYVNYLRTRYLSKELQECIFVLTADLFEKYWGNIVIKKPGKIKLLDKALKKRSFKAYRYLLERWELF